MPSIRWFLVILSRKTLRLRFSLAARSAGCSVKIEKSGNFDRYLTYEPANGWEPVAEETNVYARKVTTAEIGTAYSVLLNNQVTVKSDVTEAMMEGLNTANYPTLTITAYASQLYKSAGVEFTAAEAWANAPKA